MALSSNTKKVFIRVLLFLLYLLIGAGIFYAIEQSNERALRKQNTFKSQYKNFTTHYNITKKDMLDFLSGLQKALKLGFNTTTERWPIYYRWDFMNAFHFAGNVVTTIGYGHITPVTFWGQMVCIIYALFGIPLTGLTLRSIGNRISEFIGTSIRYMDRRIYNRETEKIEIKTAVVAFICLLVIIFIPAVGFRAIEDWEYMEAVYFCFVTLTTIGFGDFVPGAKREPYSHGVEAVLEFLNLFYMVLGLAVMSGVIVSISGVIEEKTKNFGVDPLEALRNIRVENLNSRALKKLGYRMGPGPMGPGVATNHTDDVRVNRLPPRMATKSMGVAVGNTTERSRSAETMDFQGPTPVMHLNKQTANTSSSNDVYNTGSQAGSKIFNNKIAPVTLTENDNVDSENPNNNSDGLRKPSENNSTSTESAEEARASDEDNEVAKTLTESNEIREEAELDGVESFSEDSKNNLVVQVQLTPMPSPRESPVHTRSSLESIPLTQVKSIDADSEKIETYEGGSIDSSQAFRMDRTDSIEESKTTGILETDESKDSVISQSSDTTNARNTHHKPRTKDLAHSKTKNGFIPKTNQSKPVLRKGGTIKSVEHIDLGDKSISKMPR